MIGLQILILKTLFSMICINGVTSTTEKWLSVVRNETGDIWSDLQCKGCSCRPNSTYMVNKNRHPKTRSCFGAKNIENDFGGNNILNINKQKGVHYVPYQTSTQSWSNQKRDLYTMTKMNSSVIVTAESCKMAYIKRIEVFNYENWQVWETNGQIEIETSMDNSLSIKLPLKLNYTLLSGHLINIKIQCHQRKNEYNLLLKFQGKRNYTSQTHISALPPKTDKNLVALQPTQSSKQSASTTANWLGIIIGATVGGIGFIVLLVAVVLLLYNRRLKKQHLSVIEKQKNGVAKDGSRVIVNKDVLDLAHEILQEHAEKIKSRPDVVPEQEKTVAFNKKLEPDFEYFQEKQPGNDYETNKESLKQKKNVQDDLNYPTADDVIVEEKDLPVVMNTGSYVEPYTELFVPPHPPKIPLEGRDSVVYEPIIDEKSGYADPVKIVNHKETEPYQGIYLQPVDNCVPVYDKPAEPWQDSELDNDDEDDNAYEVYGKD